MAAVSSAPLETPAPARLPALHRQWVPRGSEIRMIAVTERRVLQRDQEIDDTRIITVGIQVGGEKPADGRCTAPHLTARVIVLLHTRPRIIHHTDPFVSHISSGQKFQQRIDSLVPTKQVRSDIMTGRIAPHSSLAGQVALVTGGGRGIGRAMAQALAEAGAAVAVTARTESELGETVQAIRAAGGTALVASADITDPQAVKTMVQTVQAELGAVDLLVNHAGRVGVPGPIWQVDPIDWRATLGVNLMVPSCAVRRSCPP